MGLKLFNTFSRSIQDFTPIDSTGKNVGMYCCGPTVYDFAHIGNWRTFVFADLVRRYLEFKGFSVTHVMNITDVEDKIIKGVRETKKTLPEFTGQYETAFFADMKTLNCLEPHHKPRATEHIADIIALIEKLVGRGIAYQAADRSVYFSIEKYQAVGSHYGQLVKLKPDELRPGERVKSDEYAKESVADFALWKARVPEDGDVFWPSPWGEGRPGWHIECSAMSMKILGPGFDLHLGGEDLIFPHHEDEIAQSEGATGRPFVKYWLHGAFLLVEGKKMSKSLGNFFTLRDLLAKGFTGREIRYALLQAHYRESFNFTLDGLHSARTALARIDECVGKLREIAGNIVADPKSDSPLLSEFSDALDDDLNVSRAWASVFKWVRENNLFYTVVQSGEITPQNRVAAAVELAEWKKVDSVLGNGAATQRTILLSGNLQGRAKVSATLTVVPAEIVALLEARQAARKAKDFKRADAIRNELKTKGWVIEDTPKGPKLKKS